MKEVDAPMVWIGVALGAILVAISIVDLRKMVIPNEFNILLAGAGLGTQATAGLLPVVQHIAFAAVTFLVFWATRRGHFILSGRVGLGLGDVKMLAAAACWIGPLSMPLLLLIASASALLVVGGRVLIIGPQAARLRVPFGPFISLGLGCVWVAEASYITDIWP